MKRIIACAAAILLAVNPAFSACQSLVDVAADFDKAGITKETVISMPDVEMAQKYLGKSGLPVPEVMIGIILVPGPKGVVVGIVDPGLCVSGFTVVPTAIHTKALDSLSLGM